MSEFQFAKSQRVIVPADRAGAEGVQGFIVSCTGYIHREPSYHVMWACADMLDENEALIDRGHDFSESELLKAQPPKMISVADAEKMIAVARTACILDVRAELDPEINRLQLQVARYERSALRRASRSRKRR